MLPGVPDSHNAYTYAKNNPLTFSDPTGLCYVPVDQMAKCATTYKTVDEDLRKIREEANQSGKNGGGNSGSSGGGSRSSDRAKHDRMMEENRRYHQGFNEHMQWLSRQPYHKTWFDRALGFLWTVSGGEDAFVKCPAGDKAACAWTAVGFVPFGKAFTAIRLAARYADDVAKHVDDVATVVNKCSFAGKTLVLMGDGTKVPIDQIQVGDTVIAIDPETGEQAAKPVEQVWVHQDQLVDLRVDGEVVTTTEDHPFWNHTDQRFEGAQDLDPGDMLLSSDGGKQALPR